MFKRLRAVLVSIFQMLIPPPTLPTIKEYKFPDHDKVFLVDSYDQDKYNIKNLLAENGSPKNSQPIIE